MPCSNPVRKNKRLGTVHTLRPNHVPKAKKPPGTFYRPRNHETQFFKIVREHFDEFERIYPKRYQAKYGYWRPVLRSSIDKFLKSGDLKKGFARVRCPDCHEEFFVAFCCRQRSCCPTCDQKRALFLGHRLRDKVFADVPHRQWVFTIPRRFRCEPKLDYGFFEQTCL